MLLNVCMCLLLADAETDSARAVLALAAAQVTRPAAAVAPKPTAPVAPAKAEPCCETHAAKPAAGSYLAARDRAVREGKPLIVWVGGNFCDRCVKDSANEFIHHFAADGWEGHRGPATVVSVPHGDELYYVASVNRWTVGSHDWGHVPSARRITGEWRERAARGDRSPLRMLDLGDGGKWGWPADRREVPSYRNGTRPIAAVAPVRSAAPVRAAASC